jgi:thiamine-phosphate pyrophosphorylase
MKGEYGTYLVTQADLSADRSTAEVVEAAVAGGIDAVQLREKHATALSRYELGRELRRLTADAGVDLIVNDRIDLAAAVEADGVHLGEEDLPISVARDLLGDAVVGRSVSSVEAARRAEANGADYLGVGAVFATTSKDVADEESEVGLATVGAIADAVDVPLVGIGGITAGNAAEVVAAGASGVAVISAITGADDPETATRELADAVAAGRSRR